MDIMIRNGLIVDGSGKEGFKGDVGIAGERIRAVGKVPGDAPTIIDAAGMVVAPGFVDIHAHSDFALLKNPGASEKLMQGVTTNVVGNCGLSPAPANEGVMQYFQSFLKFVFGEGSVRGFPILGDYLRALEQSGSSLNVASYAAHGIIRYHVTQLSPDPPSEEELERMKTLVRHAMEDGAFGLSSGLIYPPGNFAETRELIELCNVVAEYDGVYSTHIRDEGERLEEAVSEAIEIGGSAGVAVQIAHHKAHGEANWGKSERSLKLIERARSEGIDLTADQYPYTASSTVLGAVLALKDLDPEKVLIASAKYDHSLEGKRLSEIAKERGKSARDVADEINSDEDGAVMAIFFEMHEDDVVRIMKHPTTMIGSDGAETEGGKPHPRLYGTFPRVLGRYVREKRVLTLEEAVKKMTSMSHQKLGIKDRGLIKEGYFADIVVFDPDKIADTATYENPRSFPVGIPHVLVNGTLAVKDGKQTDALAGKVLRKNR